MLGHFNTLKVLEMGRLRFSESDVKVTFTIHLNNWTQGYIDQKLERFWVTLRALGSLYSIGMCGSRLGKKIIKFLNSICMIIKQNPKRSLF